ncbi:hypothetical protein L1987_82489 [Smallanthus sonchifolius]|uniref:Uncharacterized protein n=1 Tax=Smallanthus sonchifolius TaxID=185202 RepID=A0ACB8Y9Z0_9ASTR|nr:hypothetical protein L1987_82489 [Smallanthus sonchifolius]
MGFQCGGLTAPAGTTILDAVKEAVGDNTEVVYEEYPTAKTLSEHDFSYAIVAVGEEIANLGSADDNSELKILFKGDELLKLVAQEIPTLAIVISGRPLVLEPSVLETLDALVAAWLPGTEGNGITDVIFGDYESGGRLLGSWPKDSHQNIHDPLFPDGYGLKSKLWLDGLWIEDWEALDQLYDPHCSNYTSALSSAINEGVDMVTIPLRYQLFLEDLAHLVESGEVSMARIDDAVERILRAKFAAGLFEHAMADRSLLDSKPHGELAREAVRKSLVLLKNRKRSKKTISTIEQKC